MSRLEITESSMLKSSKDNEDNEIGVIYDDKDYTKIPLDHINLNTEPISIINDFGHSLFNNSVKSYIKIIFGFIVFLIIIILISILANHFQY